MKVRITRTSVWATDGPPCEEAVKKLIAVHGVDVDGKELHYFRTEWHYILTGGLKSLVEFVKKHGECVITYDEKNKIPLGIEIYDNYRE